MDSGYGLDVTPFGSVHLDGGTLLLAGESDFGGTVDATANGGTIRLRVGPVPGGNGLVRLGNGVNFQNCTIEILFQSGFTPDTAATFDLFDPIDDADLAAALETANTITTPADWILDRSTGLLSFVPLGPCISGPNVGASQLCRMALDYDSDTDVDLRDFATYQRTFGATSPGTRADHYLP